MFMTGRRMILKKIIETDENIDDLLQKLDESSLYKKIDDHWNLFIVR